MIIVIPKKIPWHDGCIVLQAIQWINNTNHTEVFIRKKYSWTNFPIHSRKSALLWCTDLIKTQWENYRQIFLINLKIVSKPNVAPHERIVHHGPVKFLSRIKGSTPVQKQNDGENYPLAIP